MFRGKFIKLIVAGTLVLLSLWVATPKVYVHILLRYDHTISNDEAGTNVKSESNDACDFEKYDKPAYFNIFKFISGFIPSRQQHSSKVSENILEFSNVS